MAAEAPNSYTDPYWSDLATSTEQKLGLPSGLLVSLLTKGERSNADQISEAGARTPFQVTPTARALVLKRDGIDAYLSPENAAEVAGLVAKDGVNWAKQRTQDPAAVQRLAAGYYHAGGDTDNWGPRTLSYMARVTGAQPAPAARGTSTFDRAMAATQPDTSGSIANVYKAYQSGQMSPQDASDFESAVNGGQIMLPRGAALKASAAAPPAPADAALVAAYESGKMTPADAADFQGLARSGAIKGANGQPYRLGGEAIPSAQENATGVYTPPPAPVVQPPPTLGQQITGAGEAVLSTLTGATGGAAGMVLGGASGAADAIRSGTFGTPQGANAIEQAAQQGAQALTYAPRGAVGQDYAGVIGEGLQQAIPALAVLPGMAPLGAVRPAGPAGVLAKAGVEGTARDVANLVAKPAEVIGAIAPGAAGDAAAGATAAAGDAISAGAAKVASMAKAATTLPRRALERLTGAPPPDVTVTPGTMGGVGAAGTDVAAQRQALARSFPVPFDLTKGQASRDAAQLKFEVEAAKMPELGAPLRERGIRQNQAIYENLDTWIDQTGAEAPTLRATGAAVDRALVDKAARAKTEVNVAYRKARQSPEAGAVVDPSLPVSIGEGDQALTASPIDYLNSRPTGLQTTGLTDYAKQAAVKLGVADMQDGQLVGKPTTIRQMEDWRKEISQATGYEPADIRNSTILKSLIDQQTEPVAGPLYRQARATRARYAQEFEDRAVISKLLNNKRGTADRQVALEDVFKHSVLDGSLDDVRTVRKVLQTGGSEGQQAWRELQGATVRHIRDEATKSVALDSAGNRVISPAALDRVVRGLDVDGRLDFIFGRQGAQRLRDIRDLAQVVRTVPPEAAVNMSNTASTLLAAFGDAGLIGMTGAPVPIVTMTRMLTRYVKDRALRQRIEDALRAPSRYAPNNRPDIPQQLPSGTVVH